MIEIIGICHKGVCTPLYVCQFAAYTGAQIVFLDKDGFTSRQLDAFKGVIDPTQGVTVAYVGPQDVDWTEIRSALIEYVKENSKQLVEEWNSWRVRDTV